MDFEDEDGAKDESYESDLQKCIASFIRQEPYKKSKLENKNCGVVWKWV